MSAGRICTRIVATTAPTETVRAAARRMADHEVGTLVVVAEEPEPHAVGVITDRDITIRGVAEELDLDQTPVSHLMSSPVRMSVPGVFVKSNSTKSPSILVANFVRPTRQTPRDSSSSQ